MSLVKNSSWNMIGTAASAAVMIPAMGFFARELDTQAFGLLTLVMAFVGYASVLDGGFSRALVREVACAKGDLQVIQRLISTAIWVVAFLGAVFGLLIWLSSHWIVSLVDGVASPDDAILGFKWSSLIVLPLLLSMVGMAPLEGQLKFAQLNIVRSVGYALVFGVAIIAVGVEPTFTSAVIGLLIGRILMGCLCFWVGRAYVQQGTPKFYWTECVHLYRFGGWVTVSNLISPLMDYLDRFVLSTVAGVQSLAFYAAPAEGVQKLQSLPGSVARALFPMLSGNTGASALVLALRAVAIQSLVGLCVAFVLGFYGQELMGAWLGQEYAEKSGQVIQILGFGIMFNAVAMVPQVALQAMGKAKSTAIVHMIEILPFIGLLYLLTAQYGITGTAVAWVIRTFADMCLMAAFYYWHVTRPS